MFRLLLATILLAAGSGPKAGVADVFTLVPATAGPQDTVQLRIDGALGCYRADSQSVDRAGSVVEVRFDIADVSNCLPQWVTPRLVNLGTFIPGSYEVRIVECRVAAIPCQIVETLQLQVAGQLQQRGRVVPALSIPSMAVLLLATLALAAIAVLRLRRE